jgi:hypothetical protein
VTRPLMATKLCLPRLYGSAETAERAGSLLEIRLLQARRLVSGGASAEAALAPNAGQRVLQTAVELLSDRER